MPLEYFNRLRCFAKDRTLALDELDRPKNFGTYLGYFMNRQSGRSDLQFEGLIA